MKAQSMVRRTSSMGNATRRGRGRMVSLRLERGARRREWTRVLKRTDAMNNYQKAAWAMYKLNTIAKPLQNVHSHSRSAAAAAAVHAAARHQRPLRPLPMAETGLWGPCVLPTHVRSTAASTVDADIMLSMTSAVARHCISPRCCWEPGAGLEQLVARRRHSVDGTDAEEVPPPIKGTEAVPGPYRGAPQGDQGCPSRTWAHQGVNITYPTRPSRTQSADNLFLIAKNQRRRF